VKFDLGMNCAFISLELQWKAFRHDIWLLSYFHSSRRLLTHFLSDLLIKVCRIIVMVFC